MTFEMVYKLLNLLPPIIISLAWPIAIILIVFLLRQHLQSLIDRLEKAETKWFSITLKAINDIKADFAKVKTASVTDEPIEEYEEPETTELYAPVAEVMSVWFDVEQLCQQILEKNDVHVPKTYRALGSRLMRSKLIDAEYAEILGKLRQVRNIAAHGGPDAVGTREAREYVLLAERMITYLNRRLAEE